MFFIIGINSGQKQAEYDNPHICGACGRYGRYQVFMTYTYLSLFFIPVLKWGRQYFARTTCCESLYRLDSEVGKAIFRKAGREISSLDVELLKGRGTAAGQLGEKVCPACGYQAQPDFDFCPKCGGRF